MRAFNLITLTAVLLVTDMADTEAATNQPDPPAAFIRSMIIPGWGHYYADSENWNRGKVHLGAEAAFIVTYVSLLKRASTLEQQYITLASLRAGVNISDRGRPFQLAIGEYSNLAEYNDWQLRSRNWNRLIDHTAENQWNWKTEDDRISYNELRSDRDRVKNQLPGILALMAVNRTLSAISAYNRARNQNNLAELSILPVIDNRGSTGAVLTVNYSF